MGLKEDLGAFMRKNAQPARTASFAGINDKGKIDQGGIASPCHANLTSMGSGLVMISNWHQRMTDHLKTMPFIKDFAEFLVQRSNFSEAFITKEFDDILENGFIVDCNFPRDFVASACVATRVCYEKPNKAKFWSMLTKEGLDERLAFLTVSLISNLELQDKKYLSYTISREQNHFAYTPTSGPSKEFTENVLKGNYKKDIKTFKEKPGYTGFTYIWGQKFDGWLENKMKDATETLTFGGRDPNILNPWGKHPPIRKVLNFNVPAFNNSVMKEIN